VRERSGIQDDEIDTIGRGLLHAIDEFMLGVALVADQRMTQIPGDLNTATLYILETV
jgi:hypothetical protein